MERRARRWRRAAAASRSRGRCRAGSATPPCPGSRCRDADYTNAAGVEQRFGYPTGFCDSTLPGATATTPCRLVPDVSAQADEYTGAPTFYSEAFKAKGSRAAGSRSAGPPPPARSGRRCSRSRRLAHVQVESGDVVGGRLRSPLLYADGLEPTEYAASFNDITEGNNDVYGLDGGKVYPATPGYDRPRGWARRG